MRQLVTSMLALLAAPVVVLGAHPYGDDQIEVVVGEPFTISSSASYHNFPTLHQISPKQLLINIWATPDADVADEDVNEVGVWTEDGGNTWGKPVTFHGKETGGHSWIRRRDGACVWLSYLTRFMDDGKTYSCHVGHSKDGKNYTWSVGKVTLPEVAGPSANGNASLYFARSILEMPDGSLLATMYSHWAIDPAKFRSLLVRSTDNGLTWDYYSTVAFSPDAPAEGYNETAMVPTSDGELLSVMRVGSGLPMRACRSEDNGRTWSGPRKLPDYAVSVFPDAVLMQSGILAVSFGRPGVHIMFSVDGKGRRWTSRTTLPLQGASDCYTGLREVAPGRLLYVYHEALPEGNAIRGVFVDVKRK